MKRALLTCLAVLSFAPMVCLSTEEKRFAPLRPQILAAKTVFLAGGPPDVLDKANGTLAKWGRFQVVSDPEQADVEFEFVYGPATTPGLWSESLTITDAKSREVLYEDGRVISTLPPSGAVPAIVGAFRHPSMARDMLKDLQKRIEATESARIFEYTLQFETRAAKYFTDAAALEEKLAALWSEQADSLKRLVTTFRGVADTQSKETSGITHFLASATVDDLLRRGQVDALKKDRDENLAYTCSQLALAKVMYSHLVAARHELPEDVNRAFDRVGEDATALSPDCSSELAIDLLKKQPEKPPGN